jgi:hypothetical protein
MALWGLNDDKTSTGTVSVAATGVVTGSGTDFENECRVGDFLSTDAEKLVILEVTNSTQVICGPQTLGGAISTATANQYTLQEAPMYVATSEVGANAAHVFGVDTTEMNFTPGVTHAGWVRRTVGTGGRSGRIQYETLVATSNITSDAADDSEFPDS